MDPFFPLSNTGLYISPLKSTQTLSKAARTVRKSAHGSSYIEIRDRCLWDRNVGPDPVEGFTLAFCYLTLSELHPRAAISLPLWKKGS